MVTNCPGHDISINLYRWCMNKMWYTHLVTRMVQDGRLNEWLIDWWIERQMNRWISWATGGIFKALSPSYASLNELANGQSTPSVPKRQHCHPEVWQRRPGSHRESCWHSFKALGSWPSKTDLLPYHQADWKRFVHPLLDQIIKISIHIGKQTMQLDKSMSRWVRPSCEWWFSPC